MNMFWELLETEHVLRVIKCIIVFQELNCDPVKKNQRQSPGGVL